MKFILFIAQCILLACISLTIALGSPIDDDGQRENLRSRRDHGGHGVTGPVHTFVKTDKNANFKWGVRHHVGHHYSGRK